MVGQSQYGGKGVRKSLGSRAFQLLKERGSGSRLSQSPRQATRRMRSRLRHPPHPSIGRHDGGFHWWKKGATKAPNHPHACLTYARSDVRNLSSRTTPTVAAVTSLQARSKKRSGRIRRGVPKPVLRCTATAFPLPLTIPLGWGTFATMGVRRPNGPTSDQQSLRPCCRSCAPPVDMAEAGNEMRVAS